MYTTKKYYGNSWSKLFPKIAFHVIKWQLRKPIDAQFSANIRKLLKLFSEIIVSDTKVPNYTDNSDVQLDAIISTNDSTYIHTGTRHIHLDKCTCTHWQRLCNFRHFDRGY